MKKLTIIACILFLSTAISNAQFFMSFTSSVSNYNLKSENNFPYNRLSMDYSSNLGYYFKNNIGIVTGLSMQNRNFILNNEEIKTFNYQIPILLSKKIQKENSPFGMTLNAGYCLTIPIETQKSNGDNFDIGFSHGFILQYTFDFWLNNHSKFFAGNDFSLDLYNKNKILMGKMALNIGMAYYF